MCLPRKLTSSFDCHEEEFLQDASCVARLWDELKMTLNITVAIGKSLLLFQNSHRSLFVVSTCFGGKLACVSHSSCTLLKKHKQVPSSAGKQRDTLIEYYITERIRITLKVDSEHGLGRVKNVPQRFHFAISSV